MADPSPYLNIHRRLVAGGALTDTDRIAPLGSKLYADTGWTPAQRIDRKLVSQ